MSNGEGSIRVSKSRGREGSENLPGQKHERLTGAENKDGTTAKRQAVLYREGRTYTYIYMIHNGYMVIYSSSMYIHLPKPGCLWLYIYRNWICLDRTDGRALTVRWNSEKSVRCIQLYRALKGDRPEINYRWTIIEYCVKANPKQLQNRKRKLHRKHVYLDNLNPEKGVWPRWNGLT